MKLINSAKAGAAISAVDLGVMLRLFDDIIFGVMGLKDEAGASSAEGAGASSAVVSGLMDMVLEDRAKAKAEKDWARSDSIRESLKALGITVKDTKNGAEWSLE